MEKPNLETYGLTKNELENYPKNKSLFDLEYKKHLKANKRTCLFIALSLAILLFAFLAFVFSDNTPNDGVGTAVVIMLFFGLPVIMLIAFIIYNHMDKKEEIKARFFSNELEDRYTKYVDALEEYNHFIEQNNRNYWIQMTGLQFEKELACLFRSKGYDATVTSATGDGGVDIILRKDGEKIAVQCKHHAKPVGPNDVRALQGVVASQNYSKGIFISLNGYTSTVYQEIRRGTIKIDLLDLKDILKIAKNDVLPCTKDPLCGSAFERELTLKAYQSLDDASIDFLSGKTVMHKTYGEGIITFITDRKYIEVYFLKSEEEKKFVFPDAFADKHLVPVNFRVVNIKQGE